MHDPLSVREIIRRCSLVIGTGPRGLDLFFQKLSLDTDSFWSTFAPCRVMRQPGVGDVVPFRSNSF